MISETMVHKGAVTSIPSVSYMPFYLSFSISIFHKYLKISGSSYLLFTL